MYLLKCIFFLQVDVAFVEEDVFKSKELLISTSITFDCSLGGSGIMHLVNSGTSDAVCYDTKTSLCKVNL